MKRRVSSIGAVCQAKRISYGGKRILRSKIGEGYCMFVGSIDFMTDRGRRNEIAEGKRSCYKGYCKNRGETSGIGPVIQME